MSRFLPFARSRMCPSEASTAYWRPRNFFRVRVFAGLSTITRFLAMGPFRTPADVPKFLERWAGRRHYHPPHGCRKRAIMRLREWHACQVLRSISCQRSPARPHPRPLSHRPPLQPGEGRHHPTAKKQLPPLPGDGWAMGEGAGGVRSGWRRPSPTRNSGPPIRRPRVAAHPAGQLQLEERSQNLVDRRLQAGGDLLGEAEGSRREGGEHGAGKAGDGFFLDCFSDGLRLSQGGLAERELDGGPQRFEDVA